MVLETGRSLHTPELTGATVCFAAQACLYSTHDRTNRILCECYRLYPTVRLAPNVLQDAFGEFQVGAGVMVTCRHGCSNLTTSFVLLLLTSEGGERSLQSADLQPLHRLQQDRNRRLHQHGSKDTALSVSFTSTTKPCIHSEPGKCKNMWTLVTSIRRCWSLLRGLQLRLISSPCWLVSCLACNCVTTRHS